MYLKKKKKLHVLSSSFAVVLASRICTGIKLQQKVKQFVVFCLFFIGRLN